VVDVEFRVLAVNGGGVSMLARPQELVVLALSLAPKRIGGCKGEDMEEVCECCEGLRPRLRPGSAKDKEDCASAACGEAN